MLRLTITLRIRIMEIVRIYLMTTIKILGIFCRCTVTLFSDLSMVQESAILVKKRVYISIISFVVIHCLVNAFFNSTFFALKDMSSLWSELMFKKLIYHFDNLRFSTIAFQPVPWKTRLFASRTCKVTKWTVGFLFQNI